MYCHGFESHPSNLPVEITDYTVIKRVNTELYTDRLQNRITNNWMFFLRTRLFGSMDFINNSLSIVSGYHLNSIHYDVYSILFFENSSIWQFISKNFYLWLKPIMFKQSQKATNTTLIRMTDWKLQNWTIMRVCSCWVWTYIDVCLPQHNCKQMHLWLLIIRAEGHIMRNICHNDRPYPSDRTWRRYVSNTDTVTNTLESNYYIISTCSFTCWVKSKS